MIIYLLTNRTNGKYYVGQTTQLLRDRIKQHELDARRKRGPLQEAIRKYGIVGFDVEVLAEGHSVHELNALETLWILLTSATDRETGYNCTSGGLNHIRTDDSRAKMRVAKLGHKQSPELVAKRTAPLRGKIPWNKGTKRVVSGSHKKRRQATEEERQRLTRMRHQQILTPERNAKISATMKGRMRPALRGKPPWNKGLRQTPEQIEKNRCAHIGLKYPGRKKPATKLQAAKQNK